MFIHLEVRIAAAEVSHMAVKWLKYGDIFPSLIPKRSVVRESHAPRDTGEKGFKLWSCLSMYRGLLA